MWAVCVCVCGGGGGEGERTTGKMISSFGSLRRRHIRALLPLTIIFETGFRRRTLQIKGSCSDVSTSRVHVVEVSRSRDTHN